MLWFEAHFSEIDLDKLLNAIFRLPDAIRPIYFSDNDSKRNKKNLVTNTKLFDAFIEKNRIGFFLRGEKGLYDIHTYPGLSPHINFDAPNEFQQYIMPLFEAVAPFDPCFAYAADREERIHRNRCFKTIGINHIESWVGRDFKGFLPGLYCHTLISDRLVEKFNVDLAELVSAAPSHIEIGDQGQLHLFKFYDDTTTWRSHTDWLDELCSQTRGVFSKRRVLEATAGVEDFEEYLDIMDQW